MRLLQYVLFIFFCPFLLFEILTCVQSFFTSCSNLLKKINMLGQIFSGNSNQIFFLVIVCIRFQCTPSEAAEIFQSGPTDRSWHRCSHTAEYPTYIQHISTENRIKPLIKTHTGGCQHFLYSLYVKALPVSCPVVLFRIRTYKQILQTCAHLHTHTLDWPGSTCPAQQIVGPAVSEHQNRLDHVVSFMPPRFTWRSWNISQLYLRWHMVSLLLL